jgi:uncharacterized protein Smg (DUF494 family)
MTAKVVEAVAKILEGLNKNRSFDEVNRELKKNKDFDQQTLSAAFGLVYDKILAKNSNRKKDAKREGNRRIFNEEEKEILGAENCNYLLHLLNVGLLDEESLEVILEQITLFPADKITKEDINWIVLISLVDLDSEYLPGSRVLLYSSDTIN